MKKEEFKKIDGFDNYMVGNYGTIINIKPFHKSKANNNGYVEINGKLDKDGYRTIGIYNNLGKRKHVRVHRLVANAFCENDNPEINTIVNHKDGNKQNNHYKNLEWCDISYNTKHGYTQLGRKPTRVCKPVVKIDKNTKEILKVYDSIVEAAFEYGINPNSIINCLKKRNKGIEATSCGYIWEYLDKG